MVLFMDSTKITLGDWETTSFWHDNWCAKGPLSLWAPDRFKIDTRKDRTVAKGATDNNWIRSVPRLRMPVQLSQYIEIRDALQEVTLTPTQPDTIAWCLTTDGAYNASSDYHAQFLGCHSKFIASKI
jgi:hypothetical protein